MPPYERVLQWLDGVCGGRAAVTSLDSEPLTEDRLDLPEVPDRPDGERLEDAAALLDAVSERWFDAETSFAFRSALLRLRADDPWCVRTARSAAHLAGGVCWTVGKANDLFPARGGVTMSQVQGTLGLGAALSSHGQTPRGSIGGRTRPAADPRPIIQAADAEIAAFDETQACEARAATSRTASDRGHQRV